MLFVDKTEILLFLCNYKHMSANNSNKVTNCTNKQWLSNWSLIQDTPHWGDIIWQEWLNNQQSCILKKVTWSLTNTLLHEIYPQHATFRITSQKPDMILFPHCIIFIIHMLRYKHTLTVSLPSFLAAFAAPFASFFRDFLDFVWALIQRAKIFQSVYFNNTLTT